MKIGLVIGSGALKCASAIGVWKVLIREGIPIHMAVGCSGGSLYASTIALGWPPDEILRKSERLWRNTFEHLHYRSMAGALFPPLFGRLDRFGLIDDRRINTVLREAFGATTFTSAVMPLHIVATEVASGEKVVLTTGSLFDAIRASIAIPLVLRPWSVDGHLLFDGGACDPLPADVAVREGCDIIVAIGFENPIAAGVRSALGLVNQTSSITINHLLRSTYAFYSLAHHAELIPILPEFDRPIGLRDTHLMPYIVEQGERAAEREIPYLRRLLAHGK